MAAAQFFVGRTLSSTYTSLNRLVWQVISSLAALSRFDVALHVNNTEYQTNRVLYTHVFT